MIELHLRPTSKLVTLSESGASKGVVGRIWQGQTANGIPVHAYIARVAVSEGRPDHEYVEFEEALEESELMRPEIKELPLKFFVD